MTEVEVTDKGGHSIKFLRLNGRLFPRFRPETLSAVPDLQLLPNDVILVNYPKSGTNWVWEVAMMLMRGFPEKVPSCKESDMMEWKTQEELHQKEPPRLLNTHFPYPLLPKAVREGKHKIIYLSRNPKDVAVSYYNHHKKFTEYYHYHGKWEDYLLLFIQGELDYGSWFDYTLEWENILSSPFPTPIHWLTYEDMKEDPIRETRRLAEYLGIEASPSLVEAIADSCQFHNMAKGKSTGNDAMDVEYSLMFRKGQVGDWKNWFTVAQNEMFDQVYAEKMKNSKLKYRFSL